MYGRNSLYDRPFCLGETRNSIQPVRSMTPPALKDPQLRSGIHLCTSLKTLIKTHTNDVHLPLAYGEEMRGAFSHHWFSASSLRTNAAKAARDSLVPVLPSPTYPAMTSLSGLSVRIGTRAIVHTSSPTGAARIVSPNATTSLYALCARVATAPTMAAKTTYASCAERDKALHVLLLHETDDDGVGVRERRVGGVEGAILRGGTESGQDGVHTV